MHSSGRLLSRRYVTHELIRDIVFIPGMVWGEQAESANYIWCDMNLNQSCLKRTEEKLLLFFTNFACRRPSISTSFSLILGWDGVVCYRQVV